jgi:hypothetical protein
VKEYFNHVVNIICLGKEAQFAKISLSRNKIACGINELATRIENTLKSEA